MGRDGGIGHIRNRAINVYILAFSLLIPLCIMQNAHPGMPSSVYFPLNYGIQDNPPKDILTDLPNLHNAFLRLPSQVTLDCVKVAKVTIKIIYYVYSCLCETISICVSI